MPKPDISVVMGVYNGARYLADALDSIQAQDGVQFEFVIVDDGSSDESPEVLRRHAATDPRLRIIEQENAGLTRALISACAAAQGRYIARQDDDDLSLPGRLQQLQQMLDTDAGLVMASSGYRVIGPGDELLYEKCDFPGSAEATRRLLHERMGPIHGTVMFRAEDYHAVGGYRAEFYYAQDSDLWLRLAERGRIAYAPQVLYVHRLAANAISASRRDVQLQLGDLGRACRQARLAGQSEAAALAEAERVSAQARLSKAEPGRRRSVDDALYFIAVSLLGRVDARGFRYLGQLLRRRPWHWRGWLALLRGLVWQLIPGLAPRTAKPELVLESRKPS